MQGACRNVTEVENKVEEIQKHSTDPTLVSVRLRFLLKPPLPRGSGPGLLVVRLNFLSPPRTPLVLSMTPLSFFFRQNKTRLQRIARKEDQVRNRDDAKPAISTCSFPSKDTVLQSCCVCTGSLEIKLYFPPDNQSPNKSKRINLAS